MVRARSCRDRARPAGVRDGKRSSSPESWTGAAEHVLDGALEREDRAGALGGGDELGERLVEQLRVPAGVTLSGESSQSPARDRVPVSVATTDVPKRGASSRQRARKSRFSRLVASSGAIEVAVAASPTIAMPASSSCSTTRRRPPAARGTRSSNGPPSWTRGEPEAPAVSITSSQRRGSSREDAEPRPLRRRASRGRTDRAKERSRPRARAGPAASRARSSRRSRSRRAPARSRRSRPGRGRRAVADRRADVLEVHAPDRAAPSARISVAVSIPRATTLARSK